TGPSQDDAIVVDQSPNSNTRIQILASVHLTTQLNLVTVPNVIGSLIANATTTLQNAGLVLGTVSGSTGPNEKVVGQSPGSGKQVTRGSAVNVSVTSSQSSGFSRVVAFNCSSNQVYLWAFDQNLGSWNQLMGSPVSPGFDSSGGCPQTNAPSASLTL